MKTKLHYVLSIAILLSAFSSIAQNSTWKKVKSANETKNLSKFNLDKNKIHLFELDMVSLKKNTSSASLRESKNKKVNTVISIPGINGEMESFSIYEVSVFAPDLAAKYPNIKSYVGVSTDNTGTRLRMSVSPQGVQTMISYIGKSTVFMQPITKGSNKYVLYNKDARTPLSNKFKCKTINKLNKTFNKAGKTSITNEGGANDKTLRKFRLAISTTSEYTAYHDDKNPANGDAVADALAAINTTISRVNEVFETDMAIRFELVNATQLIYTDANTDPYSNANIGTDEANLDNTNGWSLQLQNTLTSVIGNSAYDIGHLFGATGGGGNAGCIGCVCIDDDPTNSLDVNKGSGFTSPSSGGPESDTFDIDFVAHEIGHQMGANHTWAFDSEGTGVNSEPGSGSTIMAYAGLERLNNVELNSDDYFHYHSIRQILDNINTTSCQTTEAISNNPPIANAGNDYNIPKGTAYILKGAATDADGGDNLTYCWEQIDYGITDYLNFGSDLASGSTNRSLRPSNSPNRYIPRFSSVLAGKTTQKNPTLTSDWETVSTVARNLNWALTVRDRTTASALGGQTSYDTMRITVEDAIPFTVTNPLSWSQSSVQTITWEVGSTNNATINCQNVNIKLSTDSGLTFPITIASNTANDGSFDYTVPVIPNTTTARILIEAADNIFYDVSNFDFSISNTPEFFLIEETLEPITCKDDTAIFHFNYATVNSFSENTVFSASGIPTGAMAIFTPASLNTDGSVVMTISNLNTVTQGNYSITITGTSPSITKIKNLELPLFNTLCLSAGTTEFNTGTTLVKFNTINNASTKPSGYSDYTAIVTNVNRDRIYNLSVNVNTDGNFTTATKVWIDWNQNCSFNDPGEEYNLGDATQVTNDPTDRSPFTITIPSNANLGETIMRVTTKYKDDGLPTSCDNGFDGEVEDYTLNVLTNLDVKPFGITNLSVFPNPSEGGVFNIKLSSALSSVINISVFDLRGRIIYEQTYQDTGEFNEKITLNGIKSGMYILKINDGIKKSLKKIIVK
ncbi:hypothetical protein A8C32_12340 [Flavivirga aquatica]|uniref:Uncharacterized protein n=1 Tax=Flavivirga aquatica TaxID=1849968 RepID=A0A1E5TDN8_9FLAO|nr:zinc-dependent metalloprotease family protein [Flavivirga aquatica]OEK09494.1 hypothetical protein A8C32_12340 [Flavivirga aquatica]